MKLGVISVTLNVVQQKIQQLFYRGVKKKVIYSSINIDLEEFIEADAPPEKLLFLCVVLQALLDATKPSSYNEPDEEAQARKFAQSWLFASVGVTAEDFIDLCDLAGIDAKKMQTFAFKILKSKEIKYVRRRINTVLSFK